VPEAERPRTKYLSAVVEVGASATRALKRRPCWLAPQILKGHGQVAQHIDWCAERRTGGAYAEAHTAAMLAGRRSHLNR